MDLFSCISAPQKCLEKKYAGLDALGPRTTDEFLTQAFVMYQKLEILLHGSVSVAFTLPVCFWGMFVYF